MFSITTTQTSNAAGAGVIIAKGHGKQRTWHIEHDRSDLSNLGAAVGVLLNVLTTPEQQAKLRHPSGKQRVRVESLSDAGGKHRFTIDV